MYGEQEHNRNRELWPGWETVRLIGRGSFGSVYEIRRDVLGNEERAALKVITIPQNSSDIEEMYGEGYDEESITATFHEHLKSIVNEYSLMRKLNGSSNVVSCDDVRYIQHENGLGWDIYIKMELLTSLTRALPQQIPEETAIRAGIDLCHALELCKKHDIIHRDIKPQNIFVSDNGDFKLGDFGIAKTVEKTMGGTKVGTYKYMAPEVYNNQPYGGAADIYSLGMVLYWLLNERRLPFTPLPPAKLAVGAEETARTRRLSGEPLPAPAHGSNALKQIVLKACAYKPQDRYSDPAQMREALEKVLSEMKGENSGKSITFNTSISELQPEEKTVGAAYTFQPSYPSSYSKPASLEERKAHMAEVYGEEERTVGVHYTPTPTPQPEYKPEPESVVPIAPDPIPDEEKTQGVRNTPVQTEPKTKQENLQPKSYKKLIGIIAVVAAVLVLAVALWRASPAGSAAQSASNQATVTVRPIFHAPTARPTSKPTAKPFVETVTFGNYPQTASGTDSTPIEWLVLARDGDKVLLLSRYGLDAQPYNTNDTNVTWEKCTLRTWLNDTFYNKAFTTAEQKAIETTAVSNAKDQCYRGYRADGGNNTQDKVFLLSYAEANKYLGVTYNDSSNTIARVQPTEYAIAQHAHTSGSYTTSDGKAVGYWWLRSPGDVQAYAAFVSTGGSLFDANVSFGSYCVRPAMWVKIEAVKSIQS